MGHSTTQADVEGAFERYRRLTGDVDAKLVREGNFYYVRTDSPSAKRLNGYGAGIAWHVIHAWCDAWEARTTVDFELIRDESNNVLDELNFRSVDGMVSYSMAAEALAKIIGGADPQPTTNHDYCGNCGLTHDDPPCTDAPCVWCGGPTKRTDDGDLLCAQECFHGA